MNLRPVPNLAEPTVIQCNRRPLPAITADALNALVDANSPPVIFRHGGALARIGQDDSDHAFIEPLTRDALRGRLARVAHWCRINSRGGADACSPPLDVVADVTSLPEWPLPVIERITAVPVFAADGTLCSAPGYHHAGRLWHAPRPGLDLPPVPANPDQADIERARTLICDDLLGEFCFTTDAERAGAVALLLLPFVRNLIRGSTPFHLVEAPTPGTGKGLLVDACLIPGLGRQPAVTTEARDEDEWRKKLTSLLRSGTEAFFVDNIRRPLDSSALAAALTTDVFEDRILGRSEMVRLPVRCVFVGTGNNPVVTSEIARRTIRIRLDASIERPWLRGGFQHQPLRRWAEQNRGQLAWAALTLTSAWLARGRPPGNHTLGSYETWAHTIGGILNTAGIPGFLDNLSDFYSASDGELDAWRAFTDTWWHRHASLPVTAADLWDLAEVADPPLPLGAGNDRSRRITFGKALSAQRGRIFGDLRITTAGTQHRAAVWQLEQRREEHAQ